LEVSGLDRAKDIYCEFHPNGVELNTYLRDNQLKRRRQAEIRRNIRIEWRKFDSRENPGTAIVATGDYVVSQFCGLGSSRSGRIPDTGNRALVFVYCDSFSASTNLPAAMGYDVSGATTFVAGTDNQTSVSNGSASKEARLSGAWLHKSLNAGTNVFTAKYKTDGVGTVTFKDRRIAVIPL
jgi:hypothetical protein